MLLNPCNDIHMWLMSIPIDVVFLSPIGATKTLRVTSVYENLRPWKIIPVFDRAASQTLELPAGSVGLYNIKEADILCIS